MINNILIDEKSHENILIFDISCKTLFDQKPLRIRFLKIYEIVRICDGTRYLILFGSEKYEAIYKKIRYLINQKSEIRYIFSDCFAKIKVNSYDSLPIILYLLTFHNVVIHIQSILNKYKNHYYYKFFLGKCSYQLAKKIITNFCA